MQHSPGSHFCSPMDHVKLGGDGSPPLVGFGISPPHNDKRGVNSPSNDGPLVTLDTIIDVCSVGGNFIEEPHTALGGIKRSISYIELNEFFPPDASVARCPICEETLSATEMHTLTCGHSFCMSCLELYLESKIKSRDVLDLVCPSPGCRCDVTSGELQYFCDPSLLQNYVRQLGNLIASRTPNAKWCPKPDCNTCIIVKDAQSRKVSCSTCNHTFCGECQEPYHLGSCDAFNQWKSENAQADGKLQEWIQHNSKPCPSCQAPIEKSQGCNHMKCAYCFHQFCWICGQEYSPSHYSIINVLGCPGLQNQPESTTQHRVLFKVLVGAGLVVGGVLALSFALPVVVVGGPILLAYKIYDHYQQKQRRHEPTRPDSPL